MQFGNSAREGDEATSSRDGRACASDHDARAFLAACDAHLRVVLQPLYALDSSELYGFEALSRGWDKMGYHHPHDLFERAAELGVLAELETRQIERAIVRMSTYVDRREPVLFVNLDSRILLEPKHWLDRISHVLEERGLSRRRICIELSEQHEKTTSLQIERNITEIRALGYQIGLDDFGAGVSDIKALYKYELNFLKIDGFFIQGLATDHRKRFFVASIVELAHMLGQKVVAEGIETAEDLAICRQLRCDIGQGFHLARPLEAEQPVQARVEVCDLEASSLAHQAESLEPYTVFLPALPYDMPMTEVLQFFARPEAPALFPVVGDNDEPIGLVRERSLRRLVHSRYGFELVSNKGVGIELAQFVTSCPTVDVSVDVSRLAQYFAHDGAEGVVVTSDMRYIGFLPAAKLLQLHSARQLREARDANPLTHLGGNGVVNGFIQSAAAFPERDRVFCYMDFDNFKPFNDAYGFSLGDRAILLFAALLKQSFSDDGYVLGHIGGDDFFAGADCADADDFCARMAQLQERFRYEAESLYSATDRAAGGIQAYDRDGEPKFFPLLSVSAGVLHAPKGCGYEADLIGATVAKLKSKAKAAVNHIAYTRLDCAGGDCRACSRFLAH